MNDTPDPRPAPPADAASAGDPFSGDAPAAGNPLLDDAERPAFDAIAPAHVGAAVDALLADAETALQRAVDPGLLPDWDALAMTLDVPVERLMVAWGHVTHLQGVADTPALRAAYTEQLPRIVDFTTRLGADERLYAKYRAVAAAAVVPDALTPQRRKALDDTLRDFVLGGADLRGAARERYAAIQDRSAALSQAFGEHVLDATDAFALDVAADALDGVPDDVRAAALAAADGAVLADGGAAHRLTLKGPCYFPVMQTATSRGVREALYRAYGTRASEFGPAERDNGPLMHELLALRHEEAALLGHATFAHAALVRRMARSPAEVLAFVRDLARRARPHAERELADLRAFAAAQLGLADLQPWDRAFAAERLKKQRHDIDDEALRPYFTEPRVLAGLFDLVRTLFGVEIGAEPAPVWHPDVRHYRVRRDGAPVAAFYLDPYARAGKHGGAWMGDLRSRWRRPDGRLQQPVAHLVCNFAPPQGGRPALLRHDDVVTLFHEFGHGLHHLLTQVDERAVAGIAGVEGDAVELPSQFMENFCWEWDVLQQLSSHVDSGRPLPRERFDRMLGARHFQAGLKLLRQCEFALLDMRLHSEPDAAAQVQRVADEVAAELLPVAPPPWLRSAHTFTHLFDGGYGAGYYGYAWAEVLSADAFGAFEEAGVLDAATGERFRRQILEVGGSRPAMASFEAFRGRPPRIDAMLRRLGLG